MGKYTVKGIVRDLAKTLKVNDSGNYIKVEADLSDETWNTVASHELLTITGLARITIIPEVTVEGNDTTGDTSTICLGHEEDTDAYIADTQVDDLAAGEIWLDGSPTEKSIAYSSVIDELVNNVDIGYEIKGEAAIAGTIVFHCWYEEKGENVTVVEGAGGSLT